MDVPCDLVEDRLEHVHRHKPHPALYEAAREQAGLAESIHAVAFASLLRLVFN